MSADGWREDLDGAEWCANPDCNLDLPKHRDNVRRYNGKTYCVLCFDIIDAIGGNEWMKTAQKEYREHQQQQKKLKPGEDYCK